MLVTFLDSAWKTKSKLADQLIQNLTKNYPDFLDLVDLCQFQHEGSFLLQSLIQL